MTKPATRTSTVGKPSDSTPDSTPDSSFVGSVKSMGGAVRASFNPDVRYSDSPLLADKTPLWRSYFVTLAFALGFVTLAARAAYVQVLERDFYQRQGEVRHARTIELPAERGRILSSDGRVIAANVPAVSVWAAPEDARLASQEQLAKLALILGMNAAQLVDKLQLDKPPSEGNKSGGFVWLKRQISADAAKQIEALKLDGIYVRVDTKRAYPEGAHVSQLLGFVNLDGKGVEGFERSLNDSLTGTTGKRRVIKDRMGRVVEEVGETLPAANGRDATLTIDQRIQSAAAEAIKETVQTHRAKSGSVVVMDANTFSLLAVANYPTYSPEQVVGKTNAQIKALLPYMRNRALVDSFEPGSVMKPLSIALALDAGLVNPQTPFQTAPGHLMLGSAKITDAHAYGQLTVAQIVQKSSNVGTVKITSALSEQQLWQHYKDLGLGQKPSTLGFPGVEGGRLRNHKSWGAIGKATQSYGYGLSLSLVQLASAYGAIANDGIWHPPSLVKTSEGVTGATGGAVPQRIVSAQTAAQMREMLRMAAGDGGTAPLAQIEGFTVGGKTGTTHKVNENGKGYWANRYRSTFVGMSPIDKPRIVVAVTVDEPSNGKHYGGEVAAPAFAAVTRQTLQILGVVPDKSVLPLYTLKAAEESID